MTTTERLAPHTEYPLSGVNGPEGVLDTWTHHLLTWRAGPHSQCNADGTTSEYGAAHDVPFVSGSHADLAHQASGTYRDVPVTHWTRTVTITLGPWEAAQ